MRTLKLKFTILLSLALSIVSCEKERGCTDPRAVNFDSSAEIDDLNCVYSDTIYNTDTLHTSCYKDSISKKLHVDAPLNSGPEEQYILGYWLDELQFARRTSNWDRLFMVAVLDKKTLEPWHSQEHGDFGHLNYEKHWPGVNGYNFYFKNNSQSGIENLMSFVEQIPDSNYVLFYTFRGNHCQRWLSEQPISAEYEAMFNEIGANVDSLKNYPNNWPYILLFKKGDPSTVEEEFYYEGLETGKILCLETTITNY